MISFLVKYVMDLTSTLALFAWTHSASANVEAAKQINVHKRLEGFCWCGCRNWLPL